MKITVCKENGEKRIANFSNSNVRETVKGFAKILKDGECLIISEVSNFEVVRMTASEIVRKSDKMVSTYSSFDKTIAVHHGSWLDYPDIHERVNVEFRGEGFNYVQFPNTKKKHGIWTDVVRRMCDKGCRTVELRLDDSRLAFSAAQSIRHHIVKKGLPYKVAFAKATNPQIVRIVGYKPNDFE